MIVPIAFSIAVIASCAYVMLFGGRTGRWGGAILLATWPISWAVAPLNHAYGRGLPDLFFVDLIILIGLVTIALASTRRWPIWVAAFQLNTVAAHLAILLSPAVLLQAYYAMITVWGVPMLAAMVIGTRMDRKFQSTHEDGGTPPETTKE
ncbi:MAG TPA: hypothetical protein VF509_10085 [Sphingobium sp.]